MFLAAERLEGIERRGMPGDQDVEEVPHGSHGLVLGGTVSGALENGRDRSGWIEGLRGGQKSSLGRRSVYGDVVNDNLLCAEQVPADGLLEEAIHAGRGLA